MPNLISLTGGRNQVRWATQVRSDWLAHCCAGFRNTYPPEAAAKAADIMTACINRVPDAAWWIEHRGMLREAFAPVWQAEMDRSNATV